MVIVIAAAIVGAYFVIKNKRNNDAKSAKRASDGKDGQVKSEIGSSGNAFRSNLSDIEKSEKSTTVESR